MSSIFKPSSTLVRNGMHYADTNFEDLANAIIILAAEDYRQAYREANINTGSESVRRDARKEARKIERFFRSDWYNKLTSVDGEYMIKTLRKQALEELL